MAKEKKQPQEQPSQPKTQSKPMVFNCRIYIVGHGMVYPGDYVTEGAAKALDKLGLKVSKYAD